MSRWRVGDTRPNMVIDCFDGTGAKANLSEATEVRLKVWKQGVPYIDKPVNGSSEGVVTVSLLTSPEVTAEVGTFKTKVLATWSDGTRQHYPPADQYMTYTVTP